MRPQRILQGLMIVLAVSATVGSSAGTVLNAADRSETLVYAVYDGQDTASNVFKSMMSSQHATGEWIESYAIVSKDIKGKVRVRDQRKTDAGVGAVVGGVIGLVGGPIGVAAGATAGGAMGYLTGDAVGIPRDKVETMKQSMVNDSSALVVVLQDKWVQNVEHDMNQANARHVIANQIATGTTAK